MPDLGIIWDRPLSKGHLMKTEAHVRASDGHLVAVTRTRSVVALGGFHGAVQVMIADADGVPIAHSDTHTFGVTGVLLGQSDRTDTWGYVFSTEDVARATQLVVIHAWNPQWLTAIPDTVHFIEELLRRLPVGANAGVGGSMAWPQMAPWTIARTGRRQPHPDDLLQTTEIQSIDEAPWSEIAA